MEILPKIDFNLETGIFLFFCLMAFFQFIWIVFIYMRLLFHKDNDNQSNLPPVSIIISARNEEDNLFKLLPHVLDQDYPNYEVVVVNHQSVDESKFILQAYQRQYKHLKVIELEKNHHIKNGKKLPLTLGIKGATHDYFLMTDADCKPNGRDWLRNMSAQFTDKKKIVLGYGPYIKGKGFLNRIVRLDTVMIAMNYLSYAKAKIPYMGVGRNLAYTRAIFEENSGFKSHIGVQSGDDDLFIQEVAKNKNYTICLNPKTFCYSPAEETWEDWYRQKSRHFTTTAYYGVFKKLMLGIYPLTLILLYTSFITLCTNFSITIVGLSVFTFIILLKWIIQGLTLGRLKEKGLAWAFPIWDLFYAILAPVIYYSTEKNTKAKWK